MMLKVTSFKMFFCGRCDFWKGQNSSYDEVLFRQFLIYKRKGWKTFIFVYCNYGNAVIYLNAKLTNCINYNNKSWKILNRNVLLLIHYYLVNVSHIWYEPKLSITASRLLTCKSKQRKVVYTFAGHYFVLVALNINKKKIKTGQLSI
jgi:hypothetical protein